METKLKEITDPHKLHDKLFKKEQVSPIEVIYNSFSNLGYNVVRRPAGQCLGNLRYFNLFYDKHTHHFYQKDRKLRLRKSVLNISLETIGRCLDALIAL